MSSSSYIFLSTGLGPHEVAHRLAEALGGEAVERAGDAFVAVRLDDAEVGGEVSKNIYREPDPAPEDVSVLNGYDTVFEIRRVPRDEDARQAAAARLFGEVVERLPWPALLVEDLDLLRAAWRPGAGRADFPPGTTPDAPHRELWQPYDISR